MRNLFIKKSKIIILLVLVLTVGVGFSKFENNQKEIAAVEYSVYDELHLSEIGLKENIFNAAVDVSVRVFAGISFAALIFILYSFTTVTGTTGSIMVSSLLHAAKKRIVDNNSVDLISKRFIIFFYL